MPIQILLEKDLYKTQVKDFLISIKDKEPAERETAIDEYAQKQEEMLYNVIKSMKIIIEIGTIQVQGSSTAQSNITPILLSME
jgi:hypothetical protein